MFIFKRILELGITVNSDNSCCDVSQFSKQTILPFPERESSSTECFDIVYCDVWGPYDILLMESVISFSLLWMIFEDVSGNFLYLINLK